MWNSGYIEEQQYLMYGTESGLLVNNTVLT